MKILKNFSKARVLCIGDVMLDRYIYGSAERISPEAPIPVLKKNREKEVLGGVGNVAANVQALGATAFLATVTGNDEAGRMIAEKISGAGGKKDGIVSDDKRPTTVKIRFVAGQQQLLRVDHEETRAIEKSVSDRLRDAIKRFMPHCDVVIMSDYAKGVLSRDMVSECIRLAKEAQKPVIVDPKVKDFSFYRGASLITPNRKELEDATGLKAATDEDVATAARKIIADCGIDAVIATRSQDGLSVVTRDRQPVHIRAAAREVFDVSGAGDTVVATLAAAMAAHASLEAAAELANIAAGIVVGKFGTATVTPAEIEADIANREGRHSDGGAVTLAQALAHVDNWRAKGLKIGFTNGCFDLLHPGHISLLRQAREQCDRLIVGLNTDNSVRRLKGPSRPVQNENARATVLKALESVDLVVLFDEDTPIDLIKALAPDLLVKGSDYTVDKVVGADFVQARGGRVFLAKIEDGFSTTATVRKISG